jgi:hypothetical protein
VVRNQALWRSVLAGEGAGPLPAPPPCWTLVGRAAPPLGRAHCCGARRRVRRSPSRKRRKLAISKVPRLAMIGGSTRPNRLRARPSICSGSTHRGAVTSHSRSSISGTSICPSSPSSPTGSATEAVEKQSIAPGPPPTCYLSNSRPVIAVAHAPVLRRTGAPDGSDVGRDTVDDSWAS